MTTPNSIKRPSLRVSNRTQMLLQNHALTGIGETINLLADTTGSALVELVIICCRLMDIVHRVLSADDNYTVTHEYTRML